MLNEDLTKIDFISAVGQDILKKYIRENFDGNDSSFKEFFKTVKSLNPTFLTPSKASWMHLRVNRQKSPLRAQRNPFEQCDLACDQAVICTFPHRIRIRIPRSPLNHLKSRGRSWSWRRKRRRKQGESLSQRLALNLQRGKRKGNRVPACDKSDCGAQKAHVSGVLHGGKGQYCVA